MAQGNNNDTAFDRYGNDSNDTFFLFKPKILNAIKFIRDRKNLGVSLIWIYLTI